MNDESHDQDMYLYPGHVSSIQPPEWEKSRDSLQSINVTRDQYFPE